MDAAIHRLLVNTLLTLELPVCRGAKAPERLEIRTRVISEPKLLGALLVSSELLKASAPPRLLSIRKRVLLA